MALKHKAIDDKVAEYKSLGREIARLRRLKNRTEEQDARLAEVEEKQAELDKQISTLAPRVRLAQAAIEQKQSTAKAEAAFASLSDELLAAEYEAAKSQADEAQYKLRMLATERRRRRSLARAILEIKKLSPTARDLLLQQKISVAETPSTTEVFDLP